MSTIENKRFIQGIHAELAKGNGKPFVDSLAEDFSWIMKGRTAWSRTYKGKQVVQEELLKPLYAQFEGRYLNTAERFIAEDDFVVVQCEGKVSHPARQALRQPVLLHLPAGRRQGGRAHGVPRHRARRRRRWRRRRVPGSVFRIGELATRTGRSVHAIRWYEAQGLVPGVARDEGGRRVYGELHVSWLDLMERLRATGMSIAEMREYTALVMQGSRTLRQRRDMLAAHRERVNATIAEWRRALTLVDRKIDFYDAWMQTGQRPPLIPADTPRAVRKKALPAPAIRKR